VKGSTVLRFSSVLIRADSFRSLTWLHEKTSEDKRREENERYG